MEYIDSIRFSHLTLFLFFALPFIYYGYQFKYWYLPDRLRFCDFLLTLAALALCGLVVIKLLRSIHELRPADLQLMFLHLGPPVLALFAVCNGKRLLGEHSDKASKDDTGYQPQAVASGVQDQSWNDLVINEEVKEELLSIIKLLKDPEGAKDYGLKVPKGILLNGPPGTGKTSIARAIAHTAGLSFFALRPDEIVSKWVGESEKNLTKLFESAAAHAPAVIFIDEIDSLGKKRSDKNASHSDNLLNHLLQLMDGVLKSEGIYIVGATNRAELVDEALKRAGRLNRVVEIPLPDLEARKRLFELYLRDVRAAEELDVEALAKATDGNSAADIKEICNQAALHAYRRDAARGDTPADSRAGKAPTAPIGITSVDMEAALSEFAVEEDVGFEFEEKKGSAMPQPLNDKIEHITWDDLIVDDALKQELMSVVDLLKDPQTARRYGIDVPKGILLNGPPGTGKTTLAKVIANTANLSFFVLQTNEIVSKWVGESEKNLTRLFKAAAKHAPSVIFIDEIDSIGKNRAEGNAQHADSLLNHLLQLIDGVIKMDGIYIIAATNRADLVDPALTRGGRLNRTIEVPPPNREARRALFNLYLSKLKLAGNVNLDRLADACSGRSAADIRAICNQAGLNAYKRESISNKRDYLVQPSDLQAALADFAAVSVQ